MFMVVGQTEGERGRGPHTQSSASTAQTPLYVCVRWPTEAFLSASQRQEGMPVEELVGLSGWVYSLQSAVHRSCEDCERKSHFGQRCF